MLLKGSLKTGVSFGLTSGIITTLGLIVGLHSGTHSQAAVIGGILTIAVADSLSDAVGIHISEESENAHTHKEIWISTGATFLSKLALALTFLIPVLFLSLTSAIIISIVWGLSVLSFISYRLAVSQKAKPWKTILEHLAIALVVIATTHYIGKWISVTF